MYFKGDPLYPFGFGLSYTTFKYSSLKTSANSLSKDGSLTIRVDLKNKGKRAGEEVVQLYVTHLGSSSPAPIRELRGFQRVSLQPDERKTVELVLSAKSLGRWDERSHAFTIEPGKLELQAGSSSADIRLRNTVDVTN
jgi:beta-glucosidase